MLEPGLKVGAGQCVVRSWLSDFQEHGEVCVGNTGFQSTLPPEMMTARS